MIASLRQTSLLCNLKVYKLSKVATACLSIELTNLPTSRQMLVTHMTTASGLLTACAEQGAAAAHTSLPRSVVRFAVTQHPVT